MPLIDGSRDADALVEALAGKMDAARVYYAIMLLEKNGHLAESSPDIPPETAAFWHGMGIDPAAGVSVIGEGNCSRASRLSVAAVFRPYAVRVENGPFGKNRTYSTKGEAL